MARPADEAQAIALFQAGRLAEAENAFRILLARDPRNAAALHALGALALQSRRFDEAAASLARAVDSEPRDALAHYHLASALLGSGKREDARAALHKAITAHRAAAEARFRLGNVLAAALDALAGLEVEAGNARKDSGDLGAALAHYEAALAASPRLAEAALNAGSVALEQGNRARARALYEQALRARPDLADAQYALGLIALFEHDFARGWEGYERRFDTVPAVAKIAAPRRPSAAGGLSGRVAVRAEQGLGDQILFSTLLPELAARGISAAVELDPRLVPIYRRSLPGFDYFAPGDIVALESCPAEIAIGSLARHFRPSVESFARQPRALLVPDPARVREMRSALGGGSHVAISWRSFQKAGRRHIERRKSAALEAFAALARDGARLVDLQYGDVGGERAEFDARHPGVRVQLPGLDLRQDLEGIFAALAACECVVTTSNVTAHFAGALGKPTLLVYLHGNPPFHYWAPGADGRSLWYPSVRIVTGGERMRWEEALAQATELIQSKA